MYATRRVLLCASSRAVCRSRLVGGLVCVCVVCVDRCHVFIYMIVWCEKVCREGYPRCCLLCLSLVVSQIFFARVPASKETRDTRPTIVFFSTSSMIYQRVVKLMNVKFEWNSSSVFQYNFFKLSCNDMMIYRVCRGVRLFVLRCPFPFGKESARECLLDMRRSKLSVEKRVCLIITSCRIYRSRSKNSEKQTWFPGAAHSFFVQL